MAGEVRYFQFRYIKAMAVRDPREIADVPIRRRDKGSAIPGKVKLVLMLVIDRSRAEELAVKAIKDTRTLEYIIQELIENNGGKNAKRKKVGGSVLPG